MSTLISLSLFVLQIQASFNQFSHFIEVRAFSQWLHHHLICMIEFYWIILSSHEINNIIGVYNKASLKPLLGAKKSLTFALEYFGVIRIQHTLFIHACKPDCQKAMILIPDLIITFIIFRQENNDKLNGKINAFT